MAEQDRPEGYLGRVLADGAAPFPYRAGVVRLLGFVDGDGPLEVRLRSAASFGFSAVAGFSSLPSDDLERDVLVAAGPRPARAPDAVRPARREQLSSALRPDDASMGDPASEMPRPVPGHATVEAHPPAPLPPGPAPVVPGPQGAPDGASLAVTVSSTGPPDRRPAPEPGRRESVPTVPTEPTDLPTDLPTDPAWPAAGRTARLPVPAGDVDNAPDLGDDALALSLPRPQVVRHELRIPPSPATAVPPATPVGPTPAAAVEAPTPHPAAVVLGVPSGPTTPQPAASPPGHVPDVPPGDERPHPGPRAGAPHSGRAEAPRRPDPPASAAPDLPRPEWDLPTAAPTRHPTAPRPTAPGPGAPAHPATVTPSVPSPPDAPAPPVTVLVTPQAARGSRAAFWERRYLGRLRSRVWR